ncbi:lactonase family protein [Plantactinospora sp. CA-290183]|uniref:lactonase family protein n=1 Tax=Plantactinospora sp. CA-290183 TaxID=3240006 RepID=UPI003D8F7398
MAAAAAGLAGALLGSGPGVAASGSGASGSGASGSGSADGSGGRQRTEGLVFVQTNKFLGNTVKVFLRGDAGGLTPAGEYETGGLGGSTINPPVDPLASQHSLVYRHGLLFAVNAGSNSVTVFRVEGEKLERVQVIGSGGLLPVSIAVHDELVYVLNAGGDGSVQGYRLDDDDRLSPIREAHRSLGLDNTNPSNFMSAPAQLSIDPEGRFVLVSTKTNNLIDAFWIAERGWLTEAVENQVAGMPFGFTFDERGGVLATLAETNAVIRLLLDEENGKLTPVGPAVPNGQMATCWIQRVGEFYYAANAGSSTLSAYRIADDGQLELLAAVAATTEGGSIDMTTSGGFLYVQNGAAGSVQGYDVLDNGSLKLISTAGGLSKAVATTNGPTTGMEGIAATS